MNCSPKDTPSASTIGWVRSYMAGDEKTVRGRYEPEESAQAAYRQFTSSRGYEDALIMTDIKGELWPF